MIGVPGRGDAVPRYLRGFRAKGEDDQMAEDFPGTNFLRDDAGQDMIEYTLLLAAIALAGAATFLGMSRTVSGLWSIANNRLAAANTSTS